MGGLTFDYASCILCGGVDKHAVAQPSKFRELSEVEGMEFFIRTCQVGDVAAASRICLMTGDNGTNASALYRDPELLGQVYTSPYVVFEPESCGLLMNGANACGYVLGTRDTARFYERCEQEWFPQLRQRYPLPDARDSSPDAEIIRAIHSGFNNNPQFPDYPAHMHLDLLPIAQGQGWGRMMMNRFLEQMRSLGIRGVHLSVGSKNQRAIGFYQHMGFAAIRPEGQSLIMGCRL